MPVNASAPVPRKAGDRLHGFIVENLTPLKNLRADACLLVHEKTGARVLQLQTDDPENLFCVAFRTPPHDDTGLPHILEHSVLGGSKRFPVKDPFVEMVKMSMATFINAMTYNDKTVYPVASNVKQDYFNLATVYCDAVFHPALTENTFKQEGHHLEFAKMDDPASDLIVKGIVFNEMKGAYSSADDWVDRESFHKLFPDTAYGKDSGGDPEAIPDLTFPDFTRFYKELYHPSNAYIFLYGDIPLAENLAFLEQQLDGFERRSINTDITRQPRWGQPRNMRAPYPVDPHDEVANKAYVTLNWVIGDGADPEEVLAFNVLDRILLGHQAAPLRKALIDSQLGEDLTDSGYSAGRLESTFHIGLKGTDAAKAEQIEQLILDTLTKIADEGIPAERVEAAFHQLAYRYLEIASMFPLWLMDRCYHTWIYGADPLTFLRADEHLDALREKYRADPELFARMIRERLVGNTHRMTAVFEPDPQMQARKDEAFAQRMAEKKAKLSDDQKKTIVAEAQELAKLQSTPNSDEALATLPQLKVSDLPGKPKHIPTTIEKTGGVELLRNDVFANGVNYFHVDFDLTGLPEELFSYLDMYGECINKMGAAGLNYERMAERIAAHTGGISFWTTADQHVADPDRMVQRARFTVRALDDKLPEALKVVRDLVFEPDFRDEARLKDVLTQAKAAHRSSIVSNGLSMALKHAARGLTRPCHLQEIMGGLPQVRLVEDWCDHFAERKDGLVEKLEAIRAFLLNRNRVVASFTGSDGVYDTAAKTLADWAAAMSDDALAPAEVAFKPWDAPPREGLAAPMEIAYCAQVLPAPHLSHPDSGLLSVASRLLSLGYMWEEVRIKGGAYGGGCGYNGVEPSWYFYSYRDPWVNETLDNFAKLTEYVKNVSWSQTDIDRAIIGTAKAGEKPVRPGEATGTALWRHTHGDTNEQREARHAAVLKATPAEVKRAVLELLDTNFEKGGICVVSSRKKLEQAGKDRPERALAIEDIM